MLFYSRVTIICNGAFLLTLLFRVIEMRSMVRVVQEGPLGYQPLIATLIIMGYAAFILNAVLLGILMIRFIRKKTIGLPAWMLWCILLCFFVEVLYFFA